MQIRTLHCGDLVKDEILAQSCKASDVDKACVQKSASLSGLPGALSPWAAAAAVTHLEMLSGVRPTVGIRVLCCPFSLSWEEHDHCYGREQVGDKAVNVWTAKTAGLCSLACGLPYCKSRTCHSCCPAQRAEGEGERKPVQLVPGWDKHSWPRANKAWVCVSPHILPSGTHPQPFPSAASGLGPELEPELSLPPILFSSPAPPAVSPGWLES